MRLFYLSCCAALALSQAAHAQAPVPGAPAMVLAAEATPSTASLSLAQAIKLAFQFNPELAAAEREIGVAEGGVLQAQARPNPELSWLQEGARQDGRTTTLQLSQPLELGGKRAARVNAAERDRAIAVADLAIRRAAIRAAVIAAYFEALTAQERLTLAQASQQVAQLGTSAASRRVQAGKISPVEETRAKVAEASVRIELGQAVSALALARRKLAGIWGATSLSAAHLIMPAETLSVSSLPELLTHIESSPELQRAKLQVERQQAQVAVERSRRVPDVTLNVGRKRDNTQESRSQTIIGFSVPLPLFDRNQGNVLSALRRTDKAQNELTAEQNRLTLALSESFSQQDAAKAELQALREEILPGAQSAVDAATKGFELGKFNFLDVLDAQRTLFQSKTQYFRALSDFYRASAEIERIVGDQQPQLHSASPLEQQ